MGSTVFPAAGGGVTPKVSVFTSTGTFTAPSNVSMVEVFLVGAGGGGGACAFTGAAPTYSGGGGGGAVIPWRKLSVTPGTAYTVTIGAGGSGATGTIGADGGDSSFGSLLTAFGGGGGGGYDAGGSTGRPRARASIGGNPSSTPQDACGGTGAWRDPVPRSGTSTVGVPLDNNIVTSINGNFQSNFNTGTNYTWTGPGIEGFGGGGHAGLDSSGNFWTQIGMDGGGIGGQNNASGGNGSANTGGGGGGAARQSSTVARNGGNGGSGYAIVVYWS